MLIVKLGSNRTLPPETAVMDAFDCGTYDAGLDVGYMLARKAHGVMYMLLTSTQSDEVSNLIYMLDFPVKNYIYNSVA